MNQATNPQHTDVIIVGAGITGIGASYHLKTQCPDKTFCILEGMHSFGGTWLTHQYPGIRSDSDMFTFGYRFKPWKGKPIATGDEIMNYMQEVLDENDLNQYIHYNHKVDTANWDEQAQLWNLVVNVSGEEKRYTCRFLWMCQGYYNHEKGYTPEWQGIESFNGEIVHPQHWPSDLSLTDKKVVVIGSGATAATLIPNIADKAKHVSVLQRSPTYFIPLPNENDFANELRGLDLPDEWVHEITRRHVLKNQNEFITLSENYPNEVKHSLIDTVKALLPEGFDVDKHFTPKYRPWQQRIAVVPDGDLFQGITNGKVDFVTDEIDHFTSNSIITKTGQQLDADIVITATGFNFQVLGGITFSINGKKIDFKDTIGYRGMMFTGIPNMLWIMGYFRASWTLRVDLISDFVCRLLKHMDEKHVKQVVMTLRDDDEDMELLPWIDTKEFNPGYMLRSLHLLPKRGSKSDWQHTQDYWNEKEILPKVNLDDPLFKYR